MKAVARTMTGKLFLTVAALAAASFAVSLMTALHVAAGLAWTGAVPAAIPLLFVLGCCSYLLRFLRWHILVTRLAPRLSMLTSLRIYVAGFAMGLTPARAGEFLKFSLLREATGVDERQGAPILLVERLTEAVSFLGLVVAGMLVSNLVWTSLERVNLSAVALIVILALGAAFVVAMRVRSVRGMGRRPPVRFRSLADLCWGLSQVASPPTLVSALLCALAARGCDALLLWTATVALGMQAPLAAAALALGLSGLVGGASLLPAGVGAVETSLVATLVSLGGAPDLALAAALLLRLMTLWMWVPAGLWLAVRGATTVGKSARSMAVALPDV